MSDLRKSKPENNFLKEVCVVAIPVALQCMLQSSFSIVDQIMIGQLGTSRENEWKTIYFYFISNFDN